MGLVFEVDIHSKAEVLELPDTDWIIVRSKKNNGDVGYWHTLYHKHGIKRHPTYSGSLHNFNRRYKCTLCKEVVPKTAEGFKNLCDWSEA